jgi:hypothetical protein
LYDVVLRAHEDIVSTGGGGYTLTAHRIDQSLDEGEEALDDDREGGDEHGAGK